MDSVWCQKCDWFNADLLVVLILHYVLSLIFILLLQSGDLWLYGTKVIKSSSPWNQRFPFMKTHQVQGKHFSWWILSLSSAGSCQILLHACQQLLHHLRKHRTRFLHSVSKRRLLWKTISIKHNVPVNLSQRIMHSLQQDDFVLMTRLVGYMVQTVLKVFYQLWVLIWFQVFYLLIESVVKARDSKNIRWSNPGNVWRRHKKQLL